MTSSAIDRWLHKTALGDQLAMGVFFFGGIFLLWYELSYVAAFNHSGWSAAYAFHFLLAIFFAVNIYGNWAKLFLTDTTGKGVVLPTGGAPPGWTYCDACVANAPPRSHHCPLCKACSLKHDHHCWFAGTCVAHANHRYFLALCAHMAVAGVYCNAYNWGFVWDVKGEASLYTLLSFVLPHLMAVLGYETWFSFCVSTVSMIGFALTVVFTWLLQIQVAQVVGGQTRYERKTKVREYDQGLWANVEDVLGHRMFLVLLWPGLRSNLPGDGVKFYSLSQKGS